MKNIDSDAHKVEEAAASSLNSGHDRKLATSVPMQLGRVSSILSPNASYEHCPIPATLSAAAKSPLKRHRRRCGSSTPLLPPLAWPPRREVIPLEPVTYTFAELQSGRLASSSKLQLQASTALSSQSPQPSLPQAQHAQQQLPPQQQQQQDDTPSSAPAPPPPQAAAAAPAAAAHDDDWLQRTRLLVEHEGIERLRNTRVLLVGLGGVGSYAAEFLVRAGVGNLTIVDGGWCAGGAGGGGALLEGGGSGTGGSSRRHSAYRRSIQPTHARPKRTGDVVDTTNRNRQLPALKSTVGVPKAEVMAARLRDINPDVQLTVMQVRGGWGRVRGGGGGGGGRGGWLGGGWVSESKEAIS